MKKNIPWVNRSIIYNDKEIDAVVDAMNNATPLTQGKYLDLFEHSFKSYLPVNHAFAVSNGSNALDLSAMLLNVRKGDEILIPAHTWCATAISFARLGAKIVWVDINPETFVMDLETIERAVTSKTKALVVVHLYGLMCPMDDIVDFCRSRDIAIIEDCAQSLGSKIGGRNCGTYADISIFSFHANKNFTTLGEGGMITVNSDKYAKEIYLLRHNGVDAFETDGDFYWKPAMSNITYTDKGIWPFNFSIGEVQCAVGYKLMERIDDLNDKRNNRANKFINALENIDVFKFQKIPKNYYSAYHCLVAYYDKQKSDISRDKFMLHLWKKYGVQTIVQNCPLYRYPLFIENGLGDHNCPNTEEYFDNMISFPFYVWMPNDLFDYMIDSVLNTFRDLN